MTEDQLRKITKRDLAAKTWKYVQDYADAKSAVVDEILSSAKRELTSGG